MDPEVAATPEGERLGLQPAVDQVGGILTGASGDPAHNPKRIARPQQACGLCHCGGLEVVVGSLKDEADGATRRGIHGLEAGKSPCELRDGALRGCKARVAHDRSHGLRQHHVSAPQACEVVHPAARKPLAASGLVLNRVEVQQSKTMGLKLRGHRFGVKVSHQVKRGDAAVDSAGQRRDVVGVVHPK